MNGAEQRCRQDVDRETESKRLNVIDYYILLAGDYFHTVPLYLHNN